MKQPALGKLIAQKRALRGLTQQQLADLCTINIRSIQRIEAGEVSPRAYTYKFLADVLQLEEPADLLPNTEKLSRSLKIGTIAGAVYALNAILVVYNLIYNTFDTPFRLLITLIHVTSCAFYFNGYYQLGRHIDKRTIYVPAVLIALLLPVINACYLINASYLLPLESLLFVIMSGTMLVFGAGLISGSSRAEKSKIALRIGGVFVILTGILYLTLSTRIIQAGLLISLPGNWVLCYVLFNEWQIRTRSHNGSPQLSA